MMKREYSFFLTLIMVLLSLFSCNHKSAREVLSLSEAENKIAADADAILGLWKYKWVVADTSNKSTATLSEITATVIGDDSLPLSEADKEVSYGSGNPYRSFSLDEGTASGFNKFAYDFLASAVTNTKSPNIIVSPLSLDMILSVLANGADSSALEEILSFLKVPSLKALNDMNKEWLWLCKNPGDHCEFSLANSIWVSEGIQLASAFKKEMLNTYDASFHTLTPDPFQSQKEINLWINEKTHGLISHFLQEPLKEELKLALYNACYFKADWMIPFDKYYNSISPFHTSSGAKKVETMNGILYGDNYYLSDKYQAIDVLYSSKAFCMRVILPKKEYTLSEMVRNLATDTIIRTPRPVIVSIPKFKIRHRLENLTGLLRSEGLGSLFSVSSSLSHMTSFPDIFKEAELCQETVIECNESGTQVASVTGSAMATSTGERIEYVHFNVDRPFIFLILERKSGAILFAGVVRDPTK